MKRRQTVAEVLLWLALLVGVELAVLGGCGGDPMCCSRDGDPACTCSGDAGAVDGGAS